jgi:hypothetical protein
MQEFSFKVTVKYNEIDDKVEEVLLNKKTGMTSSSKCLGMEFTALREYAIAECIKALEVFLKGVL